MTQHPVDEQISGEIIRPGWKNQPPFERLLGAVVPPPCSSLMLFLKLPIAEELNSPACVRVWERRGDYCSPSRKSSCAHKGKYLCRASAWQSGACLFFSPVFFFFFLPRYSCFHNPSSPGLSAQRSSSSPTHSFFLYVFSKYSPPPLPPHSYKTLNSQQFLLFPQKVPWDFFLAISWTLAGENL